MSYSTVVKTKRDGLLSLADNAGFGGANTLDLAYEPGDWQMNAPQETRVDFLDRGRLVSSTRYGDDQALNGSFSNCFRDATDASEATMFDILNQSGYVGANWTSTLGANAEVFTVDLRLTIEGSDHGDGADHTITVTDVSLDYGLAEGVPNTTSTNWKSHTDVRPTLA